MVTTLDFGKIFGMVIIVYSLNLLRLFELEMNKIVI